MDRSRRDRIVFRPFSLLYFFILLFWLLLAFPFFVLFLRNVLIRGLGLSPLMVGGLLLLSLLGSFINIPLKELKSRVSMLTLREVSFFGVTWYLPHVNRGTRKTLLTLNVGGAFVPILMSVYILFWLIPQNDPTPLLAFQKIIIVLIVVALVVNRASYLVKGLGITTPFFVPPMITVMTTLSVYWLGSPTNPAHLAYVGGTLGTLIGADIFNLRQIPQLGAPVVSIGGAGTFDGIYTTGLVSVLLVLLLL